MAAWALIAPGPSATAAAAERAREMGLNVGVVSSAFLLAPWADFIAATDSAWWRANPDAKVCPGRKFAMHRVDGVERLDIPALRTVCNSGVLALEAAKLLGATRIELHGFDMHGTHFFGEYTNGLRNTTAEQRVRHLAQYRRWADAHPEIEVINCTPGSAIDCFPMLLPDAA